MTLQEIQTIVAAIEAAKDDDESAHVAEDALYTRFIVYVAEAGPADLSEMARAVLKTDDIDFHRWCA